MAAKRIKIDNASSKFRRQSQKREQKVIRCSVLIVCEGTKTEPNYFEAFAEKQQGVIVYDIEVKGLGRGTKDVIYNYPLLLFGKSFKVIRFSLCPFAHN